MTDREQLDPNDSEAQAEARLLAFMDEIMSMIEESNPGFWQGVDKKTRYAWMNDAFDKADEMGFGGTKGEGIQCIEILARMGLNFIDDPVNKKISRFLLESQLATSGRLVQTRDYIDWVLLDREINSAGREISLWGMREILGVMPMPDSVPPELPTQR